MLRPPPCSTRTDTLFPDSTLFLPLRGDCRGLINTASHQRRPLLVRGEGLSRVLSRHRAGEDTRVSSGRHRLLGGRRINPGSSLTAPRGRCRSEEHTSELQSLLRIAYAVVCLKKKTTKPNSTY